MDTNTTLKQCEARLPYVASEIVDYGDAAAVTATISGGSGAEDGGFDPTYTS